MTDKNAPVTVDADQLENIQKEGLIVFTGNVVASQDSSTQYADRMEVYLDAKRREHRPDGLDRERADHHQGLPHGHGAAGRVL